jgi:hypothetical protein
LPIRRGERGARQTGGTCRAMAMVRTVAARPLQQRPGLEPVARGAPQELDNLGQCRPVGGRAARGAGVRGTGPPIGNSAMGAGDRRAAEAGLHTPRTRPAPKDNQQSVMSLFLSSNSRAPTTQRSAPSTRVICSASGVLSFHLPGPRPDSARSSQRSARPPVG